MAPLNPTVQKGPRGAGLPAYVSNGLIGLRVREVPLISGMAVVSGVAGEHPDRRVEAALAVPYPLAGDLIVDGVALSDEQWAIPDRQLSEAFNPKLMFCDRPLSVVPRAVLALTGSGRLLTVLFGLRG